jgi:hypothetical protein
LKRMFLCVQWRMLKRTIARLAFYALRFPIVRTEPQLMRVA